MQQTWNLAQLFAFVRETDGQMSTEQITNFFADLFDDESMLRLTALYRDYWRFMRASSLALEKLVVDYTGGFRLAIPDGYTLLAYEYKRADTLVWARSGNTCDWLPENTEVAHRWDTASSVPTLSSFFLFTAADHVIGDIEAFLASFPSAQITCDGCYVPLLVPAAEFEDHRIAFGSLPFGDVFQRDFVVESQETTP